MKNSQYCPPPDACERLRDILPRFGGDLRWIETTDAPRRPDTKAADGTVDHGHLGGREGGVGVDENVGFIARLPGGRVFGPGAVLSPDGRSLARDVSTDFGRPFEEHWLRSYAKIKPPLPVPGRTAVVAVALGRGYCHWLLDELPRWLLLARDGMDFDNVIAHDGEPFIREALAFGMLPGGRRVLEAKRYSHFGCEELIVPGLVGRECHASPMVVRMLTEFAAPLLDRCASGSCDVERVYVTRENAARRRVVNEDALWRALEPRGFTKVRLEDMRWVDQVRLFANAKVIVAPHGAGLANLVFAAAGTRVVELFNAAYANPCFARLAEVKALDYHPLLTSEENPGASSRISAGYDLKANRNDIVADVAAVVNALG